MQKQETKNKDNSPAQLLQHSTKVQVPLNASQFSYPQTPDIISNHGILRCGDGIIQAKLKIGQPNDVYEQEADRIADAVMRMPDSQIQRKSLWNEDEEDPIQMKTMLGQSTTMVQRKSPWNEDEEDPIQMKSNEQQTPGISHGIESQIHALKGGGEPLPPGTKRFMETAFNSDFSGVRVHTDSQASEISKRINARAFTFGSDIYFNSGKFSPYSTNGKQLLAHELGHTLQQNSFSFIKPSANIQRQVVKENDINEFVYFDDNNYKSIWGLAKYYNVTLEEIDKLNPELKNNKYVVKNGDKIYLPIGTLERKNVLDKVKTTSSEDDSIANPEIQEFENNQEYLEINSNDNSNLNNNLIYNLNLQFITNKLSNAKFDKCNKSEEINIGFIPRYILLKDKIDFNPENTNLDLFPFCNKTNWLASVTENNAKGVYNKKLGVYTVADGDTIDGISLRFKISKENIMKWNYNIKQDSLYSGLNIIIPSVNNFDLSSQVIASQENKLTKILNENEINSEFNISNFIKILIQIENVYPLLKPDDLLNGLRRLGGYDDKKFQIMYNLKPTADLHKKKFIQGTGLEIVDPENPTNIELDYLKNTLAHKVKDNIEYGILKDNSGVELAMGHVLTGLSAGFHRNMNLDFASKMYGTEFLGYQLGVGKLGFGENIDNLYATTFAGDLGQSAVGVKNGEQKGFIGKDTEATNAELVGDIDGFIIGSIANTKYSSYSKLSDILTDYYNNIAPTRFDIVKKNSWMGATLLEQTKNFATNYYYLTVSKLEGATGDTDIESQVAYNLFMNWIKTQKDVPPTEDKQIAIHPLNNLGTFRRGILPGHNGVDITCSTGTEVVAALDGKVKSITADCVIGNEECGGKFGNNVLLNHEAEGTTRYAHLSKVSVNKVGVSVSQGEKIGEVGSTGRSTGSHLHFEWRGTDGKVVDPYVKIKNLKQDE